MQCAGSLTNRNKLLHSSISKTSSQANTEKYNPETGGKRCWIGTCFYAMQNDDGFVINLHICIHFAYILIYLVYM